MLAETNCGYIYDCDAQETYNIGPKNQNLKLHFDSMFNPFQYGGLATSTIYEHNFFLNDCIAPTYNFLIDAEISLKN